MESLNTIIALKKNFDMSFKMLEDMIEKCPDDLWNKKKGGYVFWQQIIHIFYGINFWMGENKQFFDEPFKYRDIFPELEIEPKVNLTKENLREYKSIVKNRYEEFFYNKNDDWLFHESIVSDKLKIIEVILIQIRHMQYHIGHCDSILRENNFRTVEWIE